MTFNKATTRDACSVNPAPENQLQIAAALRFASAAGRKETCRKEHLQHQRLHGNSTDTGHLQVSMAAAAAVRRDQGDVPAAA